MAFFLSWQSYSILCIDDFFILSSVHAHFGYFRVSAVVNAAAVHACVIVFVVWSLLLSCKTKTVPTRHSVRLPPPPLLALTICFLCLWSWLLQGPCMSGLNHYLFFHVWLMSLSIMPSGFIHAVACVRTAPPFRLDNIYCVDGSWSVCPFFCRGTRGISTFISHVL